MLLKMYDCPMLISDIDAVYRAPIRQTLPDLDVGLYVKKTDFALIPGRQSERGS